MIIKALLVPGVALIAQAGWVADDPRLAIGLGVVLAVGAVADTLDWRRDEIRAHGY